MILQQDMPFFPFSETRPDLVFAFLDQLVEFRCIALILKDLAPIKPVFNMIAAGNYPGVIPFANRIRKLVLRFYQVVKSSHGTDSFTSAQFCIRMQLIIKDLVFQADCGTLLLINPGINKIFYAAVGSRGYPEIHEQLKVTVFVNSNYVSSSAGFSSS